MASLPWDNEMEKIDLTAYNKYIRKKWAILLGMLNAPVGLNLLIPLPDHFLNREMPDFLRM